MTKYRFVYRTVLLLTLVTCTAIAGQAAAMPPAYHVTDLGTLGGPFAAGYGINAKGQVAGYSFTPEYASVHAFLYDGTLHDLGEGTAFGINDSGQVTGRSGSGHAFRYDGTMNDLGTLGGTTSEGRGINDSGQVAGYSRTTGDAAFHAFLHDSTMHDLGTLGGIHSIALGINNSGQVTGDSNTTGGEIHAFLYDGTMNDLGTLGGGQSGGVGINNSGQVTGYSSTTGDAAFHAFLYDGTLHDLGTLGGTNSYGNGINANGHVVGDSQLTTGGRHAFLYTSGSGMVDLNTLIDPLSGWELSVANAINDAGQITGWGQVGGEDHAFLLTPVPEPASFALLAVTLPIFVGRTIHRSRKHRRNI
ncbi:MAG: HAF repeat-containing protein [Pirellulales bacterium]|nr:HAF repeat-containing protein [Pirellulales bacterium]